MTHVHTVKCPECGQKWTGEFADPLPDEAVCRICLIDKPQYIKGHPDIHLNPKGR